MGKIETIKELAERGYATAVEKNEGNSKEFFFKILVCITEQRDVAEQDTKEEEAPLASFSSQGQYQRQYLNAPLRESVLTVAYFLSEYGHEDLFPREFLSQGQAIQKAAGILGVKPNTLKNQRDYFDSHTNSHREGWKVRLTEDQENIFLMMSNCSKQEALEKVHTILGLTDD